MNILVTGCAGFIGMHTSLKLLNFGYNVIGVDNLNNYYDINLKKKRLSILLKFENFSFFKIDICNNKLISKIFANSSIDFVIHLAAQAGVRYSLENPHSYIDSNLVGFINILEGCRHSNVKHLVFASSSSVYGSNKKIPFSESDAVNTPLSLYAATKRSNELMAYCYSHLYKIPITGLRFFTVYGPWGRPDQSLYLFVNAIYSGKPINVFNNGKMLRDFTYIDDTVDGIFKIITKPPMYGCVEKPVEISMNDFVPLNIFNIGNNNPVNLIDFINTIERKIGLTANKNFLPLQDGDVENTYSDNTAICNYISYKPLTSYEKGIENFIMWYNDYHSSNA